MTAPDTLTATLLTDQTAEAARDPETNQTAEAGHTAEAAPGSQPRTLVVLPSLGTAVEPLWARAAALLPRDWTVVGVDLPGHGRSAPLGEGPGASRTMEDFAAQVLEAVRTQVPELTTFAVAGDSVGGAIALQLALDHPDLVEAAVPFCTGAQIGSPEAWEDRAAHVEREGTATMVEGSIQRWFAPGFPDTQPEVADPLLESLRQTDDVSYAAVCRALAAFDVRDRLSALRPPVLAVAGAHDQPTPPASLQVIADGAPQGRAVVVEEAAHLVPAEAPARTAQLLTEFLG